MYRNIVVIHKFFFKKTNEEKEQKSEWIGLTFQSRLTRQTLDSYRESLITKSEKKIDGLPIINWANPSNQVNPSNLESVSWKFDN
jgi:hypothetical protein